MVTHLQFADDTLIFCAAKEEQVQNLVAIIRFFEAVSGLKVNLFKSEVIGISVEGHILHCLVDLMGCEVGSLPTTYLGLPLCIGNASKSLWSPVVEQIEQNLALWRAKYLSLGGKLTLIKSALANIPIYYLFFLNARCQ